jgi:hypothetical protein
MGQPFELDGVVGERAEEDLELCGGLGPSRGAGAERHGLENEVLVAHRQGGADVLLALGRAVDVDQAARTRRLERRAIQRRGLGRG